MTEMTEMTCEQRVDAHLASTLDTIGKLWQGYCDPANAGADFRDAYGDPEDALWDYGLSMDYVVPDDGTAPYWGWTLSTGGPHDEIRFYGVLFGEQDGRLLAADYIFQDWFDVAERPILGDNLAVLRDIFAELAETGTLYNIQQQELEALKG